MVGATQVEGGLSIGSANQKYLLGLSHIVSNVLTAGYTFQWCPDRKSSKHSVSLRHDYSDKLRVYAGISREKIWSTLFNKYNNGINIFYSASYRPDTKGILTPTKVQGGVTLNSRFLKLNARVVRRISSTTQVSLEGGIDQNIDHDQQGVLVSDSVAYSRMMLSWSPMINLKAYLGQQVSQDGWTFIAGVKIAGIKILLPWTVYKQEAEEEQEWKLSDLTSHLAVFSLFMIANYYQTTLKIKQRNTQVAQWRADIAPKLLEKLHAVNALIESRAQSN